MVFGGNGSNRWLIVSPSLNMTGTSTITVFVSDGLASTNTTFTLTVLFTGLGILLSEATSNTAAANLIVPVAIAVAQASGVRPLEPALAATLGASMGFAMPISTAPNAIVYSSGYVPVTSMMRHGLALDLVAFLVIVPAVLTLCGLMF